MSLACIFVANADYLTLIVVALSFGFRRCLLGLFGGMRAISPAQNVKESQRSNFRRPTREKERKSTCIDRPREKQTDNSNRSRSQSLCGGAIHNGGQSC